MHGNNPNMGKRRRSVIRAALLLLASCGSASIEPPNTVKACALAASCGVVSDEPACVACLEHVDPVFLPFVEDLPPLDTVDCATLIRAVSATNLPECINARWYGGD